jgi:septal ring factor EnvC (AmiA/AmiB activator)
MGASADNTATFAIDLNAQGAVAGANAAADSLENLKEQIDDDSAALGNMQKALKALQGGTSVNIQAFQQLKKQIEAKKATIAQTTARYAEMGGTFRKTKKPVEDNADALKKLFENMQKGGGPIGGLAGKLQGLRALLAGGGALVVGTVALVAALVAR